MQKKTIVVLDAFTLNPQQAGESSAIYPSWDALAGLGSLTLYPRTASEDVVARCADAQIVLTNKAALTAEHLAALPRLEYIGVMATGYNIVDREAARARGIPVTNVPGYSTMSVAQHVFALLFELAARTGPTNAAVQQGEWSKCADFCFSVAPFFEMSGRSLGLVGFGSIAQAVARIGAALGMRILVYSRSQKPFDLPVTWVSSTEELFREADVITLHCPLTPETEQLINRDSLRLMKKSAYLINTGRGPLVDEAALAEALRNGLIAGFGGDVLSAEPPKADNPLLSAPNTVITPHIAWSSVEAKQRLMDILVENIRTFLAGSPANVIN